jgi:hypothetical protein
MLCSNYSKHKRTFRREKNIYKIAEIARVMDGNNGENEIRCIKFMTIIMCDVEKYTSKQHISKKKKYPRNLDPYAHLPIIIYWI